jgi:hypothetical protein
MGASSVTGKGVGAAFTKGPHNGRDYFAPIGAGCVVVACGDCSTQPDTTNSGNWQVLVQLPEFPEGPEMYGVFAMQSDWGNGDGRNQYPPHIEKIDIYGNNADDGWEGGFAGFILHTGDSDERVFMYQVVKYGLNVI